MRTREELQGIINKITPTVTQGENLMLEVLLDIRDLLIEANKVEITGVSGTCSPTNKESK